MSDTSVDIVSDDELMIKKEFEALLSDYLNSNHRRKVERITKAFNFANQAHAGVKRRSGEPYIMHPLAVARIVCREMGLGSTSICSALLHDVVEDTEYTVDDIRDMFDDKIAQIVDGLTKISGGIFGANASAQAENFRKLLLSMNSDIRVILVKIADRLHNMRTLGSLLPAKQLKISGETMYIYAPLAHRLGFFSIKTELEDLSFKYEHPLEYQMIQTKLVETESDRQMIFDHFAEPVRKKLADMGLVYEMRARVKSAFSIWNKMQAKHVRFEEIYDIFAVRIIFEPKEGVDEKNLSWDIYSAITDIYEIRPDRVRDWISRPKANGYRALHVTVMGPDGRWIEIQIRSRKMDDIAEQGFAAHWKYKDSHVEEDTELDQWLHAVTEILESPDPNALDFLDTIRLSLFSSEIYVFTPKGDLKTLPQGASALDFAYSLHTNIGSTCIGAKVNHRLEPMSVKLNSGDQVEILTSRSQHPEPEWLNFVVTAKARNHIDSTLKRERREMAKEGEKKVIESLVKVGIEPDVQTMDKLVFYFGYQKREDLFYAVEKGDTILPENINKVLKDKRSGSSWLGYMKQAWGVVSHPNKQKENGTPSKEKEKPKFDKAKPYILKEEDMGRNYLIASCCKPIPGDESLGFINDDGNVVVHKRACPIALRLKSSFGERILNTVWSSHRTASFEGVIEIKGIDSMGILNVISRTISEDVNISIKRLSIESNDGVFEGVIHLYVHDVADIQKMISKLLKVKGMKSVVRITENNGHLK